MVYFTGFLDSYQKRDNHTGNHINKLHPKFYICILDKPIAVKDIDWHNVNFVLSFKLYNVLIC